MSEYDVDLLVIGGGSGGVRAAPNIYDSHMGNGRAGEAQRLESNLRHSRPAATWY
jgi:hypothetical protein